MLLTLTARTQVTRFGLEFVLNLTTLKDFFRLLNPMPHHEALSPQRHHEVFFTRRGEGFFTRRRGETEKETMLSCLKQPIEFKRKIDGMVFHSPLFCKRKALPFSPLLFRGRPLIFLLPLLKGGTSSFPSP